MKFWEYLEYLGWKVPKPQLPAVTKEVVDKPWTPAETALPEMTFETASTEPMRLMEAGMLRIPVGGFFTSSISTVENPLTYQTLESAYRLARSQGREPNLGAFSLPLPTNPEEDKMLTRKDFQIIAEEIGRNIKFPPQREEAAIVVSGALQKINPRFDPMMFLEAVEKAAQEAITLDEMEGLLREEPEE